MHIKNNLIEHNTNFNVSQFRREFKAKNNNNNFRDSDNDNEFIMIKLQNECTQCDIVVRKRNMVIIQVYKHDSILMLIYSRPIYFT